MSTETRRQKRQKVVSMPADLGGHIKAWPSTAALEQGRRKSAILPTSHKIADLPRVSVISAPSCVPPPPPAPRARVVLADGRCCRTPAGRPPALPAERLHDEADAALPSAEDRRRGGPRVYRYGRLRSVDTKAPRFYTLSRYMYAIIGILELIFMVALSVVGEREFIGYHVIFFLRIRLVCHRLLHHERDLPRKLALLPQSLRPHFLSHQASGARPFPILLGAFLLYWKKCMTYMYDVFAITEYVDVFLSIIYHSCALFDIRHKVVFSIRSVKKVKQQ
ncbi:Frag1/DRAM/Sfk1 family-containing protein [Aphelenchoides fujianensis]|nr:Frag1/DRAM/Sfk1 family-containing protein [Aphelenchoides fujianensis]